MNERQDSDKGSVVDFAVQLQVMVIILLFAALWWFETRGDNVEKRINAIEANQASQPKIIAKETAVEVGKLIEPFLKDNASWKKAEPEIMKFR